MATRRSHTKSRNGCTECKRRKVKCDEKYPCFNCTRHGTSCTFMRNTLIVVRGNGSTLDPPSTVPTTVTPASSSSQNDLGQPQAESGSDDFMRLSIVLEPLTSSVLSNEPATRELELMHHYCTTTCNTMALREDMRQVWRVVIPQEGYNHGFVMQGLLAIAALHKACLVPSQRHMYLDLSAYHKSRGLEVFRGLLLDVNHKNWKPVFCFASMVVAFVCSLPARCQNRQMTAPILHTLELFSVIRGIQSILRPWVSQIRRTTLAPLMQGVWAVKANKEERELVSLLDSVLPPDTLDALDQLRRFVESEARGELRNDLSQAVSSLEDCARHMAQAGVQIEIGMPLFWPYLISDSVVSSIQELEPHSLVLLAYFSVFLTVLDDSCWVIRGWGKQLLTDIEDHLAGQRAFLEWLHWPRNATS